MTNSFLKRIASTVNHLLFSISRERLSVGQWLEARKFGGDIVWTMGASLALKFQGVVLIVLLGHLVSVEWYGVWTLTFAITSYLTVIATLSLPNAMVRFFAGEAKTDVLNIFLFLFSIVALLSFGLAFLAMLFADQFSQLFLKSEIYGEFVRWGTLLVPMSALLGMQQDYYRAHDNLKGFSLISGGVPILQLIAVSVVLVIVPDALRALQSYLVVGFAVELILLISVVRQVNRAWIYTRANTARLKRYLKYSLPLIPSVFSAQISSNGDRFVVGYFLGAQYVGMYGAAYALASLLMLFNPPITNVLFPKISKLYTERKYTAIHKYINVGMALFAGIGMVITFGFVILGRFLLGLLLKDSAQVPGSDSLLMVTLIVSVSLIIYGVARIYSLYILIYEKTMAWFTIYLGSAILNLVLNFVLIPSYGLGGAAVSTLVTYLLIAAAIFLYVSRRDVLGLRRAPMPHPF